jgi:SAM-dependent methyltransferase
MVFNNYAKYYDLLYSEKDYNKESKYIQQLIKENGYDFNTNILDIGCGSGKHANILASFGHSVLGIDFSNEMIEIAKKNKIHNTTFEVHNAVNFNLNRKFNVVLSLFHVLSYQNSNYEVKQFIENVARHLESGAIFIFDFWYGPAVLSQMPSVKIKRLENSEIKVTRVAEPLIHENKNIVDVNYELLIKDKLNSSIEIVNEKHEMRYFFIPELIQILEDHNIEVLNFEEFLTRQEPSFESWGVCCIARKKKN